MPAGVWIAIGTVSGAAISGFFGWRIARRKTSGTVDTSQADTLWKESRVLREELRDEVRALRTSLAAAENEADTLRASLYQAQLKTGELTLRIAALEARLQRYEGNGK